VAHRGTRHKPRTPANSRSTERSGPAALGLQSYVRMRPAIASNRRTKAVLIAILAVAGCGGNTAPAPAGGTGSGSTADMNSGTSGSSTGTLSSTSGVGSGSAATGSGATAGVTGSSIAGSSSGDPATGGYSGTSTGYPSGSNTTGASGEVALDASTIDASDASACDLAGCTESREIGPDGGGIALANGTLTIPPGALASDTVITVTVGLWSTPAGWFACSQLYQFSPVGLTFAIPATFQIAPVSVQTIFNLSGPMVVWDDPAVLWSAQPTTVTDGTTISAQITQLGQGACIEITNYDGGGGAPPDAGDSGM
jgi:hypothetical protein